MNEKFLQWHTGLRFERTEGKYRPFIEDNNTGERLYSTELFDERDDAAVAASDLLDALREGKDVPVLRVDQLSSQDADHESLV
jgi:hypothetical protein